MSDESNGYSFGGSPPRAAPAEEHCSEAAAPSEEVLSASDSGQVLVEEITISSGTTSTSTTFGPQDRGQVVSSSSVDHVTSIHGSDAVPCAGRGLSGARMDPKGLGHPRR